MNPELVKLLEQQNNTLVKMHATLQERDKQIKANGQANEKTGRLVDGLGKQLGEIKKTINDMMVTNGLAMFGGQAKEREQSAGAQFVQSDLFKSVNESNVNEFKGQGIAIKSFHTKAPNTITTDPTAGVSGNGGLTLQPYRPAEWIDETERSLQVRDLLATQSITQNAIEYVRVTGFENNANYRPETTAAAQSGLTWDLQTGTVKTISHFIPSSREILNDQSRMQNFIDQKLVYGVREKEDTELLYGAGTGGALTGLMVDADVPTFSRYGTNDTAIDIIRRAITDVRLTEYNATGIVVNPTDFEQIELMKGTDGHYIWMTLPNGNGGSSLFRLPVAEVNAMTKDNFLVGAFKQGATLYDRETAHVRISDSHEDYFRRGMLAMLGEERLALTIERPQAFVKGTFTKP